MAGTVAIGIQDFEKLRKEDIFYVDKTDFIREWWELRDDVTLITRTAPLRKNSEHEHAQRFFSINTADRRKTI